MFEIIYEWATGAGYAIVWLLILLFAFSKALDE